MDYVIAFLVGTVISWVTLLIVVPIAQKLAEFALPPWPETLWKLAAIAGVANAVAIGLDPVHWLLSWIVGLILFWWLMVKWFEVDFFGAIVIIIISWVVRVALLLLVLPTLLAMIAG